MKFAMALVLAVMTMAGAQAPSAIPRGAVKGADGSYRFTDPEGRKWIYRATPFGVSRAEDVPAPAVPALDEKSMAAMRACENGDRIRFERPGPFGTYRWERAKSELNAMERAVWERKKAGAGKQD